MEAVPDIGVLLVPPRLLKATLFRLANKVVVLAMLNPAVTVTKPLASMIVAERVNVVRGQ